MLLTDAHSGQRVSLRVRQETVVQLPSNPSTGYAWVLRDSARTVLELVGAPTFESKPTAPNIVGGGSVAEWHFRATRPGEATLLLEYRRPWEPDTVPAVKEFRVRLVVR